MGEESNEDQYEDNEAQYEEGENKDVDTTNDDVDGDENEGENKEILEGPKNERFIDLFEESYLSFLAGLVFSPIPFLTIAVFSVFMDNKEIGAFYFIYSAAYIFRRPVNGVCDTMRKRASEYNTPLSRYFGFALVSSFVYILIATVFLILISQPISSFVFVTKEEITAGIVLLVGISIAIIGVRLQDSIGSPSTGGWMLTLRDLVFLLSIIALGFYFEKSEAEIFLYTYSALSVVIGLILIVDVRVLPQWPDEKEWDRSISYVKWEIPNSFSSDIITQLPSVVLGLIFGGVVVSVFETASRASYFLPVLAITIADPLLLRVSNKKSIGEYVDYEIKTATNTAFVFPLLLLSMVIGVGPEIFDIFFDKNIELIWIASIILIFARLAASAQKVFSRVLEGGGFPESVTKVLVPSLFMILVFVIVGAKVGGVLGASVAVLLSNIIIVVFLRREIINNFNIISFRQPLLYHEIISFIATTITLGAFRYRYGYTKIPEIIAASISGIALFTVILFILNEDSRKVVSKFIIVLIKIIEKRMEN